MKSNDTDITTWEWCDGIGFLIIITGIVYVNLFYFGVVKPILGPRFDKAFSGKISNSILKTEPFTKMCIS